MRISDWSSDVCSSDLQTGTQLPGVDRKQRLSRSNVGTFFVKASLDDTIYTGPHLRCANCLNTPGQLDDVGDILGPDRYDTHLGRWRRRRRRLAQPACQGTAGGGKRPSELAFENIPPVPS